VVGAAIWCAASGLHVDGLAKEPRTYEPFDPALVGARRELRLGPQSGRGAVRQLMRSRGRLVRSDEVERILAGLRQGRTEVLHAG
jgi:isopropylmalate/homocitrate/citramalate synthase